WPGDGRAPADCWPMVVAPARGGPPSARTWFRGQRPGTPACSRPATQGHHPCTIRAPARRPPGPGSTTRRRRHRGIPRYRRRRVPCTVVLARAVTPSRRRRAACGGLALAFRQDVRELLIEVEVPVFRAGRHGGVGALQEGLQGPRRGLEQCLALRGAESDADDALTVAARRPDADVAGARGAVKSLGEEVAGEHPLDGLLGSGVEGGVHG